MPVPLDLLRGMLGLLCLFFAHFLGRSIVRVRRGQQRSRHLYGWLIRMTVTGGAILYFGGFDSIAIVALVLAAASLCLGVWVEQRPQKQENLTRQIFGE